MSEQEKRKIVSYKSNPLILKVLDSIARESGQSRTNVIEGLESAGLRDLLKAIADEQGGFSMGKSEKELLHQAAVGNIEQSRRSSATNQSWKPKEHFVEGEGKMPGFAPTFTRQEIQVDSRGVQAQSVYQKSLAATTKLLKTGQISKSDIASVLGQSDGTEEILKSLDAIIEKNAKDVEKKFATRQEALDMATVIATKAADDIEKAVARVVPKKRRGA